MDEKWIKLLGEILVAAGLIIAAIKFSIENKRAFRKQFFEKQLAIYMEAVEVASIISTYPKDHPKSQEAISGFKTLYWGQMCIIEDKDVESRMYQFNEVLKLYELAQKEAHIQAVQKELKQFALILAHTCRNSSIETWEIEYRMDRFNDFTTNIEGDKQKIEELKQLIIAEK